MSSAIYARIRENPKFGALVHSRGRFAWTLSAVVLVVFYGFVMLIAFRPALVGQPVAEGSRLTVGVAAGLCIFAGFWALTALYVRRANGRYDALTAEIIAEARAAEADARSRKEIA